jgi:hypothetical protein
MQFLCARVSTSDQTAAHEIQQSQDSSSAALSLVNAPCRTRWTWSPARSMRGWPSGFTVR